MKKNMILSLAASALLASSSLALAQDTGTDVPGHPRANEIDNRIDNQENRIQNEEQKGKITPGQAARDEKRDQRVQGQLGRDEAKHNGHITKGEQAHMNKELNKDNRDARHQRHRDERRKHHDEKGGRDEKGSESGR